MKRLAIWGGGSWGTALAVTLAPNFEQLWLAVHNPELAGSIAASRENRKYLPSIRIPRNVQVSASFAEAVDGADVLCVAVPSAFVRPTLAQWGPQIPGNTVIVSATKGLEPGTLLSMSQVIGEAAALPLDRILTLSGPSFAIETARGLPTAVVVAGFSEPVQRVQQAFARPFFRVYSSEDQVGVELGGSLKNVIAIGAGIAAGLGLGHNAVAALITRGLTEITRLAVAMGAHPRTLAGLAGLGDLVLTCTGELSRNRQLGIALSQSGSASEVLQRGTTTTEGVRTAAAAFELGKRWNVTMPIADEMHAVLNGERSPAEAIRRLLDRSLGEE